MVAQYLFEVAVPKFLAPRMEWLLLRTVLKLVIQLKLELTYFIIDAAQAFAIFIIVFFYEQGLLHLNGIQPF